MVRKIPKRAFDKPTFFEAQVVAYQMHQKDGGTIKIILHVDDIGDGDWLMHCYPLTPVAIGIKPLDYDNPDQSKTKSEYDRAFKRFSMLCRDKKFQRFMEELSQDEGSYAWGLGQDENECVKATKKYINITSRRELLDNYVKVDQFNELVKKFEEWLKHDNIMGHYQS